MVLVDRVRLKGHTSLDLRWLLFYLLVFCPESIQYFLIESSVAKIREFSQPRSFSNDILANYALGEGVRQVGVGHSKVNGAKPKGRAHESLYLGVLIRALSNVYKAFEQLLEEGWLTINLIDATIERLLRDWNTWKWCIFDQT